MQWGCTTFLISYKDTRKTNMKYIALLLANLILCFALMPCSDGHSCDAETQEFSMSYAHDHSQDEEDHCSPFCACDCCSMNINLELTPNPEKIVQPPFGDYLFFYSSLYSFSFMDGIWKPPSHTYIFSIGIRSMPKWISFHVYHFIYSYAQFKKDSRWLK